MVDEKSKIRKRILNLLKKQGEEERRRKSLAVLDKLFCRPEFRKSKLVLFYASFDGEVETFEMIKQALQAGKRVALPHIQLSEKKIMPYIIKDLNTDLEMGHYGIKQPRLSSASLVRTEKIDLVVVPAVAFDKNNNRLGRGEGYYDRFLASLTKDVPTFGLAFDFQIVSSLPITEHDIPVTQVIVN